MRVPRSIRILSFVLILPEQLRLCWSCSEVEYIHGSVVSQACVYGADGLSYADSILQRGSDFSEPPDSDWGAHPAPVLAPSAPRLVWEHVGSDKLLVDIGNSPASVVAPDQMSSTPLSLKVKSSGFTSIMPPKAVSTPAFHLGWSPSGLGSDKRVLSNKSKDMHLMSAVDMNSEKHKSTNHEVKVVSLTDAAIAGASFSAPTPQAHSSIDHASTSQNIMTKVLLQPWMPNFSQFSASHVPVGLMQLWQTAWGLLDHEQNATSLASLQKRAETEAVQGTLLLVCMLLLIIVLAICVLMLVLSYDDKKGSMTHESQGDNESFLKPRDLGSPPTANSGYAHQQTPSGGYADLGSARQLNTSGGGIPPQDSNQEQGSYLNHEYRKLAPASAPIQSMSGYSQKDLCQELIVPGDSECLLTVRTVAGVRASHVNTGAEIEIPFEILDPKNEAVLNARVISRRPTGFETPTRATAESQRRIVSLHRLAPGGSGANNLMAYCCYSFVGVPGAILKSSASWQESKRVFKASILIDIFNSENDRFARLKFNETEGTWHLSGCRNLAFVGNFEENTVTVRDELGDAVADTQPTVGNDLSCKFYSLRASAGADVGLLLCCLLAIDEVGSM